MRVLVIAEQNGVSEFYRVGTPYRLLAEAGLIESATFDDGLNPALIDHLGEFEAVVFSRPDSPEHSLLLQHAKQRGLRTIVDIDDNLLLLPPSIGVYGAWHQRGTGRITGRLWHFKRNIQFADVLTVSTAVLGAQLVQYRPDSSYLILENQVMLSEWENLPEPAIKKPAGERWVGWWGIYNHWDDWATVAPFVTAVIGQRPDTKLVLLGMPELAHLFRGLEKSGQLITAPFVPPERLGAYRATVAQFDVALAPTADHPFNEGKSDLKMLQYGVCGLPVIASEITYHAWSAEAQVLMWHSSWADSLNYLLDNPEHSARLGQKLRARVTRERAYEYNFANWLNALGVSPLD